ncbi:MAG: hypothetical protein ACFCA4_18175 [Cyanophyceae cyanobacterium]
MKMHFPQFIFVEILNLAIALPVNKAEGIGAIAVSASESNQICFIQNDFQGAFT